MKYYYDDDIVLDAPIKGGKRAKRTSKKNNNIDYDDAWCPVDDLDLSHIKRNLEKEFEDIKESERLRMLGIFHVMDVPFHIVELIYKKL